jgi:hypothetical protein
VSAEDHSEQFEEALAIVVADEQMAVVACMSGKVEESVVESARRPRHVTTLDAAREIFATSSKRHTVGTDAA